MSLYKWVIEANGEKHFVDYDSFREWLTVDGRHVELIGKQRRDLEHVRLPIDGVEAYLHCRGSYADIYLNGKSLNNGDEYHPSAKNIDYTSIASPILCSLCLLSAKSYGIAIGVLGAILCFLIRFQIGNPQKERLRNILCLSVAGVCILLTVLLFEWESNH